MKLLMEKAGQWVIVEDDEVIGTFIRKTYWFNFNAKMLRTYWELSWKLDEGNFVPVHKRYKSIRELGQEIEFDNKPGPLNVIK